MTSMSKFIGLVFALFLLLFVPPAYAEERSFEIGEVGIHARVDSDGNMHVTEVDTYHFDGAFNGIIVDLNASGSDGIENFQAFEVSDQLSIPLELELSGDKNTLQYKVYSKSEDVTKVFKLTYTVKNAVQVYADTAELYWKFFDQTNPNTLGTVRIEVELPGEPGQGEITAFGHGAPHGTVETADNKIVRYQVSPLPYGEMLEVRILFPSSSVPGSTKISSEAMIDQILEEERNWVADTNGANDDSVYAYEALVLLLVNLVIGALIFIIFGKAFKPDWKGKYYRELPSDVTPAVVSYLMNYRIEPRDLMATMVDLVRKKYVSMQAVEKSDRNEENDYTFQLINAEKDGLYPHEQILINWFFGELGSANKVSLSDIRQHTDNPAHAAAFLKQWSNWQDQVISSVNRLNYIAEARKKIAAWVIIAVAIQYFGIFFIMEGDLNWLLVSPLPLLFFKPKSERRTRIGQTEYTKWNAFKRFLHDYSQIGSREPLAVYLWEHYFVYAIPLGEAKKMVAITRINMPSSNHDSTFYDSSFLYHYDNWTESFEKTISAGIKTLDSSNDGDSFSSGGGGGGGGGGRGAF